MLVCAMSTGPRVQSSWRFSLVIVAGVALGVHGTAGEGWYNDEIPKYARSHTTMYRSPDNAYRIFKNVWYHNTKYFALIPDPASTNISSQIGLNTPTVYFPTVDADVFLSNVRTAWLPGTTLAIDFVYPAYPNNHGHWTEALFPMLKPLMEGKWSDHVQGDGEGSPELDRIFLLNAHVDDLTDWAKEALTVAVGADTPSELPVMMDKMDMKEISALAWVGFENILVVTDRYIDTSAPADKLRAAAGPAADDRKPAVVAASAPPGHHTNTSRFGSGCDAFDPSTWPFALRDAEAAEAYRERAFRRARLPPPPSLESSAAIPKQITLLSNADGEEITNHEALVRALWSVAAPAGWRVRQFCASGDAPFSTTAAAFAATGLLIGRHGPLLASAALLPPGAAVYELLPFNWEWRNMAELYRNLTRSTGHIHHFAWRPTDSKWAVYASPDDRHRYSAFRASECTSKKCLMVHARAGLKVDVEEVQRDLQELLPRLEDRSDDCSDVACRVDNLCRAWPPAELSQGE
eukprot:jgi/Ulvmu1/10734/UM068_0022.1